MSTTRWPNISVVVVGTGTMGTVHGRAWRRLEREGRGVKLLGLLDPLEDGNAARLSAELGVPWFRRWEDLPLANVEVVDIASPTPTHRTYVERAAAAGKHVLCEKPLGLTPAEVEAMAAVCDRHQVRLAVGHVVRFFPAYRHAHDMIVAGQLGTVAMARMYRGGAFPRGWADWYADPAQSGGPLLDLALHDFDFLLWTLGTPTRIFAQEVATPQPPLAYAVATVRFANDALAQVVGSWAGTTFGTRFELVGTRGLLTHDSFRDAPVVWEPRTGVDAPPLVAVPDSSDLDDPWTLQLADMVDAIVEGRPFQAGVDEARAAIHLATAARLSAASGRAVLWEEAL